MLIEFWLLGLVVVDQLSMIPGIASHAAFRRQWREKRTTIASLAVLQSDPAPLPHEESTQTGPLQCLAARDLKARELLEQPIRAFMRHHEAGSGRRAIKRFLTLHGVEWIHCRENGTALVAPLIQRSAVAQYPAFPKRSGSAVGHLLSVFFVS